MPAADSLQVESGNAGTLDTHGSGWFIGFGDWARSASGLRHMPADALAQGLCVKWFWHPAGDPNGEAKPLSEGRTMSILVGPPSDFRIEVSAEPGFPPEATRVIHLRETSDFAAWGPGLHHRAFGLQPAGIQTLRWRPLAG